MAHYAAHAASLRRTLEDRLVPRTLVQYAHTLADRQADAWPVFGRPLKDAPSLVEVVAGFPDPAALPQAQDPWTCTGRGDVASRRKQLEFEANDAP